MSPRTGNLFSSTPWGASSSPLGSSNRLRVRAGATAAAAAALLVIWVLLWTVFIAGVLEPAAALVAGAPRSPRDGAPAATDGASDRREQALNLPRDESRGL